MMRVGDKVMVRDGWITQDYHVPPAEIIEVKRDAVLLRKTYVLKFDNGAIEEFDHVALKTQ